MKINFSEKTPERIEHFKGGKGHVDAIMTFDGTNRIMQTSLEPGCSIGLHRHEGNCEVMYILKGTPKIITNGVEERYHPGECHYCPEGSEHTFINDTDSTVTFFAVVPKQ